MAHRDGAPRADDEPGAARPPRPPRPAPARTPVFGLSLAAIRQRNAATAEGTAELRRSLEDKEAQANELREALDALRRTLDDTAVPPRPAGGPPAAVGRRRRRRRLVLLLVVALLAVVAVAGTVLLTRGGRTSTPTTPPNPTPSAASAASVASVPPGLPTTGPGIDAPGSDITVTIDRDLTGIDVYERAMFGAALPSLTLTLPEPAAWGSTLAGVRPVVDDLQAEVDGVAVRPVRTAAAWSVTPPAGRSVAKVVLRYRVAGTFVNVNGEASSRRLIGVPSFTSAAALRSAAPVIMRIDDPRVLSLTCLRATSGSTVCQQQTGTTFTARFPADAAPVAVLSADLRPLR